MKIKYFISIIFFIAINSTKSNSIIRIPKFEGRYENISTKNGFINYEFRVITKEVIRWPVSSILYWLEGIKNLNLLNLEEFKKFNLIMYGKNNDSLQLQYSSSKDIYNDIICKILYKTKYIDKLIYSYGILNHKNYKYFGGTPENIIKAKNLKKFTFNKDDRVSKIIIKSPEDSFTEIFGNEIIDTLNGEQRSIEIKDDVNFMVCIPNRHSKLLKVYKLGEYREDIVNRYLYYQLDKRQQKFFESISFMIGNKNITLSRDKILLQSKRTRDDYDYDYFLAISIIGCNNFIFGEKFIKLFEFSEFNLETKEVSLFMSQKKKIITKKDNNENKKEVVNSNIIYNYYIIILLLSLIAFMMSITLVKNYYKNKKIQYYNEYYNI